MRQISVLNFKGGVGKSTLAMNISDELARRGVKVLIIDCDLQSNASSLLAEIKPPTLTQVLTSQATLEQSVQKARENLYIVPADSNLNEAASYITSKGRRAYYTLRDQIQTLGNAVNIIIFDHSPNYSTITEAALLASSEMLVPCELSPFSIEGLLLMFTKLEEALIDHSLDLTGIVPFKLDRRISMHHDYLRDLNTTFSGKIYPPVRTDQNISAAQSKHLPVYEYDPQTKATEDFRAIADCLMKERGLL
jgi:chromosome partitioning protein